jgi:hypothetical protein
MIMPCINSTSLAERGGKMARVDGGNIRVGWPGAPGWTITGASGLACCAHTGNDAKNVRTTKAGNAICDAFNLQLKGNAYMVFLILSNFEK